MKFKDYYATLGVERNASADEIRKAYRRLARKYHPDVNKDASAESRFKEITEANEVLGDPEKRRKYNALGTHWQAGQDFAAPEEMDWSQAQGPFSRRTYSRASQGPHAQEFTQFSDFFTSLFGEQFDPDEETAGSFFSQHPGTRGMDQEAELSIPLEEAYRGTTKHISLQSSEPDHRRPVQHHRRTYEVKIPPGTTDGTRIRLAGQGFTGEGGAPSGDLYLLVHVMEHPVFKAKGSDLEVEVKVSPWEAALGASIIVPLIDGRVELKLPAGVSNGRRFRLKGKGFPARGGHPAGDLFARISIEVPSRLTPRERDLFAELSRISAFNPRKTRSD